MMIQGLILSSCGQMCWYVTLQKEEVCAQLNALEKRFKICHILCIRKTHVVFFVFHFVQLYIFT